ncbi:MAG: XRE family transcriptional regulator [Planctomycetia bacterium]|nr:XRE family transcriptional regulator [Planctomycetia bacterium]
MTRTLANVDRVKQLLAQGMTQQQVAARTGLSKAVVSKIANGKHCSQ